MALAQAQDSFLLVIDLQTKFLAPIFERERVLKRSRFMIEVAHLLSIPIFATEQNPERMGHTEPEILELLKKSEAKIFPKMTFSAWPIPELQLAIARSGRTQPVLVGIESHICVNQSAHHLCDEGMEVIAVVDAISARSPEMHEVGLARMEQDAAAIAHSESVAYEWLGTADHPKFKELLEIVKRG